MAEPGDRRAGSASIFKAHKDSITRLLSLVSIWHGPARSHIRVFACSRVRVFACSRVRVFACLRASRARVSSVRLERASVRMWLSSYSLDRPLAKDTALPPRYSKFNGFQKSAVVLTFVLESY